GEAGRGGGRGRGCGGCAGGAGGSGRNGAAKQVEKVASGSVTPASVPATLAVYPERKWYIACSAFSRAIGGRMPNASQARKKKLVGGPPRPGRSQCGMNSTGYAARVFSVKRASSKSGRRVTGSMTTFSSTEPKCSASQICGSPLLER